MKEKDEKRFRIDMAGHIIAIHSRYNKVYEMCKRFYSNSISEPDIFIDTTEEEIVQERLQADKKHFSLNDDYFETLIVYRKISEEMLSFDTFLMHGAVVAFGQDAFMFTAESGTGKTTHVKKWLENKRECYIVNGDKPLIKITDTQAIACGSPWAGKEHLYTNTMVPLKAIILMERSEENHIEKISFGDAFTFLLMQTHRPCDGIKMIKTLELLMQLNDKVSFFRFYFNNLKEDVFDVSFTTLTHLQV